VFTRGFDPHEVYTRAYFAACIIAAIPSYAAGSILHARRAERPDCPAGCILDAQQRCAGRASADQQRDRYPTRARHGTRWPAVLQESSRLPRSSVSRLRKKMSQLPLRRSARRNKESVRVGNQLRGLPRYDWQRRESKRS